MHRSLVSWLCSIGTLGLLGCGGDALEQSNAPADQSLSPVAGGIEVRGSVRVETETVTLADVTVALRWVIDETLFPRDRTAGLGFVEGDGDAGFKLSLSEPPPPAALVANEATERAGVAVAYVIAYIDHPDPNRSNCVDNECDQIQVGASPNTVVVYANEPWPTDGDPLFGFCDAPGVRPAQGWSLVNLARGGCDSRPVARDWSDADTIDLRIAGEARHVQPDVD